MSTTVVVGGQYGSEGKGAITAALHRCRNYAAAVRVGGPNAGHTVIDDDGKPWALRQLPVAAIADPDCRLFIAAGSEIDIDVLFGEIEEADAAGHRVSERLTVDENATVIEPDHQAAESFIRTGTTGKGIGAARASRAIRKAVLVRDCSEFTGLHVVDTQPILRGMASVPDALMLEGTQGYGLGSHAGHYPYCTSGNCRAIDFLAAVGLPPQEVETWVVLRTHPIRIAGDSGPLANETSWGELGLPPERTTVTKKIRRIGEWDWDLAQASVDAHRGVLPPRLALTFADYWDPDIAGRTGDLHLEVMENAELKARLVGITEQLRAPIEMIGTGPNTHLIARGVAR